VRNANEAQQPQKRNADAVHEVRHVGCDAYPSHAQVKHIPSAIGADKELQWRKTIGNNLHHDLNGEDGKNNAVEDGDDIRGHIICLYSRYDTSGKYGGGDERFKPRVCADTIHSYTKPSIRELVQPQHGGLLLSSDRQRRPGRCRMPAPTR
jgi:hypothetical protein